MIPMARRKKNERKRHAVYVTIGVLILAALLYLASKATSGVIG